MGVLIKCNGESFTDTVGLAEYPKISALKNLYFFGGNAENSAEDHSGNGNTGSFAGSITYSDYFASFATDSSNGTVNKMTAQYLNSSITEIAGAAMFKKSGKRCLIGNIAASTNTKNFFLGTERFVYGKSGAFVDKALSLSDSNSFYIVGFIISSSGAKVYLNREGGTSVLAESSTGYVDNDSTYRLTFGGTNYNWAMNGSADIALASFYAGAVTEQQLFDAFAFMREYGKVKGLTLN